MKKTIVMEWSKSTKGTHVYANNDADAVISTVYIKKAGLPEKPPAQITLSLDYQEQ